MGDRQPGQTVYRCRLCGEAFKSGTHVPDSWTVVMEMAVHGRVRSFAGGSMCPMTTVHACDENRFGLADYAGCEVTND